MYIDHIILGLFSSLLYRESVVSECEGKIQELKETISQLNLEKTELVTKVISMRVLIAVSIDLITSPPRVTTKVHMDG